MLQLTYPNPSRPAMFGGAIAGTLYGLTLSAPSSGTGACFGAYEGHLAELIPDNLILLATDSPFVGTSGVCLVLSHPDLKRGNVVALGLETLAYGTAGAYSALCDFQTIEDFRGPVQIQTKKPVQASYAPSTAQLLSTIRDVFALKMSEVAQVFGVSRRAAYDWLEGVTPKAETVTRIYTLSRYAEELRAAEVTNIEHYLHRPVVSGRSLLDLLKAGENIETAIAIIKRTALEEAANRKGLGRRTSDTNTASVDGFDEVSTPISD